MFQYSYDGTFEGFLCVIFEIYDRKAWPDKIFRFDKVESNLFREPIQVVTDPVKADRVWLGLLKKISPEAGTQLFKVFLSELPGTEYILYQYIKLAFESNVSIEENYAADCVRLVSQINKKVFRESHRMEAFVRFQKTADNLFFAGIEPDFNVIPLIQKHFTLRYADQQWLIYDIKRKYGIYYNLSQVSVVELKEITLTKNGQLPATILDEQEQGYQDLWQLYFNSINIPERKNAKLHLQHVPIRYWKYLCEKKPLNKTYKPINNKIR